MTLQTVLPILIPLVIVLALLRRAHTSRRLHVGRLWVTPVLVAASIGSGLYFLPHPALTPVSLAVFAAALGLGAMPGVLRARSIVLHHSDEGHLMARTSSFAVLLLGVLIALRYAASHFAMGLGRDVATTAVDASMLFALAMVVCQRIAMWRRARQFSAGMPRDIAIG